MMSLTVYAQTSIMISRSRIHHIHINRIKPSQSDSLRNNGQHMLSPMSRIKPLIPRNDRSLYVVYQRFIHNLHNTQKGRSYLCGIKIMFKKQNPEPHR